MTRIRIGTRGSPLALVQANAVKAALEAAHAGLAAEICVIRTSGDWTPAQGETLLSEKARGKAQFAHEIEAALLAGAVDIGVHSSKDMDSHLPPGLVMECFMEREDARDCLFVSASARDDTRRFGLKEGAVFGTASARRGAFLKHIRPDLVIQPLRGNVQTRLDKLANGQADVTMLALAGLNRLGIKPDAAQILDLDSFIPAAAQGAVGVECREDDTETRALLAAIHHEETGLRVAAERAVVKALDGSCRSPIGAHAVLAGGVMTLRAAVSGYDGSFYQQDEVAGKVTAAAEAQALGAALGVRLKAALPPGLWEAA